jgi:hypothetical protein
MLILTFSNAELCLAENEIMAIKVDVHHPEFYPDEFHNTYVSAMELNFSSSNFLL